MLNVALRVRPSPLGLSRHSRQVDAAPCRGACAVRSLAVEDKLLRREAIRDLCTPPGAMEFRPLAIIESDLPRSYVFKYV
jgi:hypothetical protein